MGSGSEDLTWVVIASVAGRWEALDAVVCETTGTLGRAEVAVEEPFRERTVGTRDE